MRWWRSGASSGRRMAFWASTVSSASWPSVALVPGPHGRAGRVAHGRPGPGPGARTPWRQGRGAPCRRWARWSALPRVAWTHLSRRAGGSAPGPGRGPGAGRHRTDVCFGARTWLSWSGTNECSPPVGARRSAGAGSKGDADGRGPERKAAADPQLHRGLPAGAGLSPVGPRDRRSGRPGLLGDRAHAPRRPPTRGLPVPRPEQTPGHPGPLRPGQHDQADGVRGAQRAPGGRRGRRHRRAGRGERRRAVAHARAVHRLGSVLHAARAAGTP